MAKDDVAEVSVEVTNSLASGVQAYMVLHYQQEEDNQGNSTDFTELENLLGYVRDVLAADHTSDIWDSRTTVGPVRGFLVTQPTVAADVTSTAHPGTGSADLVSPRTAAVVSARTALRGRSYRGRSYVPFIYEDVQKNGQLEAAYATTLDTIFTNLRSSPGVAGVSSAWQRVIYSRKLSTPPTNVVATAVVSETVRTNLGTIRRRLRVA